MKAVKVRNFTDVSEKIADGKLLKPSRQANGKPKFNIRVASISQIPDNLGNVENLYIPLMTAENSVEKVKNRFKKGKNY